MSEQEIIHIVPHSHWDREWYMTFEQHRFRLIGLIDSILDKMEQDPAYAYYHLDGQMIVLEDYLAVKPYNFDRLKKLINSGRLQVGPWYVLQDEYLTSDEANLRNLLIGLKTCEEMGVPPLKIGYLPDSFGNIAQMPQILAKCGVDFVVFGRGVNNIAEIVWRSEDGSQVIGAHFTPWYNNANELPVDGDRARQMSDKLLGLFRGASKIHDYLGMNGCDHQPLQKNLPQAIQAMNDHSPEGVTFIHSNLRDYMEKVKQDTSRYPVITTEMAGQDTNGVNLLISTASARVYLKQKNRRVQNALERVAEPVSVLAYLSGAAYPSDYLYFAWKQLLQNHAHDSICGCSVDEVHREMMTRYEKTHEIAMCIAEDSLKKLQPSLRLPADKGTPVAVFNSSVFPCSGFVTVTVDRPAEEPVQDLCLRDEAGNVVAVDPQVFANVFSYTLPDDAFREVHYVNRYVFRFLAENVPALGYRAYFAAPAEKKPEAMPHGDRTAENEWVALEIAEDGSLTVTDKATGRRYSGLNVYEDGLDVGDEYLFKGFGTPVTTEGKPAVVTCKEAAPDHVTFLIRQTLTIPETFDRALNAPTEKTQPFDFATEVTLTKNSRGVRVRCEMENRSGCHRVRVLFPNDIQTGKVYANGQFDVLARNIQTAPTWIWPTNEQRMQSFVALKDERSMLVVATRGLHEYEVLRDGSNTLCVNLLRCVDQLGDWGDFPTPDAQCLGTNTAEYEILVGDRAAYAKAEAEAFAFSADDMFARQVAPSADSDTRCEESLACVEGQYVWNTAFKKQESGDGVILRLFNTSEEENRVTLHLSPRFTSAVETDLAERPVSGELYAADGVALTFRPKEIKTILLR